MLDNNITNILAELDLKCQIMKKKNGTNANHKNNQTKKIEVFRKR